MVLLRWGRSAYESEESLALEARLLEGITVRRHEGDDPDLRGVEVLATTSKVQVDEEHLASPELKLVVTTTNGYDHIDLVAAQRHKVLVARCPMGRRDAVVEASLSMGIALLRQQPVFQRDAEQGCWTRDQLIPRSLALVRGAMVGVVGHGVIGQRAAQVWRALGARVWVTDPRMPSSPSFEELVGHCRVIALHCSLNDHNIGLVSAEVLARMAPGTVLLNTARGRLVDVDALLQHTHVRAGLDVFPDEPWRHLRELAARPNTLLTPHAAGYHDDLGQAVALELTEAVLAYRAGGNPTHVVTTPEPAARQ